MIEEVAHLQRLSHAHVIRGVGTYVIKRELSILLYPATAYNLETFMEEYNGLDQAGLLPDENRILYQKKQAMRQFFKCLTSTLAFIHGKLIKHMDIKPTNILVEQRAISEEHTADWELDQICADQVRYKVYLADFGISRSYTTAAEVETDSYTAFTRMYAAPEVVRQAKRGFAADIFSLGCVFLEMLTFLTIGRQALLETRKGGRDYETLYAAHIQLISKVEESLPRYWVGNASIPSIIKKMMSEHASSRPTAANLQSHLGPTSLCCTTGPEPFAVSKKYDFGDVTLRAASAVVPETVLEDDAEDIRGET